MKYSAIKQFRPQSVNTRGHVFWSEKVKLRVNDIVPVKKLV